jgi:excisionase family DNA binding protein
MESIIDELTVPEAATHLRVNEETVRRNIRSKRLRAFKRGTQWFISRDDLNLFAGNYDSRTGKIRSIFEKNLR